MIAGPVLLKVGVIGKDARTHALASKLAERLPPDKLFALAECLIPGLDETCGVVKVVHDITDLDAITTWAREVQPDLVVIGPEEPLAAGAADRLGQMGIMCFGPTATLAQIEASKSWARKLVEKYEIPGNPRFRVFTSDEGLSEHLRSLGEFVIKPDGLTGGKGVRVHPEHFPAFKDAEAYARECLATAGCVLIEERLVGQEFSLQTITDGHTSVHCPVVQDHKRAFDDDTGPNTGGMGSYSCPDFSLPFLSAHDVDQARHINERVIEAMYQETGQRFHGVLYGGFMATADGVYLIEYNARFGDPEALNVLSLLSSDLLEILLAVAQERLGEVDVTFEPRATVCKYVVPYGYPNGGGQGDPIVVSPALSTLPDVNVYWAASKRVSGERIEMTGSRALAVVGIGDTLEEAEIRAESATAMVTGLVRHRKDIGTHDAIERRIRTMDELRKPTQT